MLRCSQTALGKISSGDTTHLSFRDKTLLKQSNTDNARAEMMDTLGEQCTGYFKENRESVELDKFSK
jgi:hypothetical protein